MWNRESLARDYAITKMTYIQVFNGFLMYPYFLESSSPTLKAANPLQK